MTASTGTASGIVRAPYVARITYSDSGAVVFRFEVYPLREQSRDLASDSRLLWIAVIAGANFAVAQVSPRTEYDHLHQPS